MSTPNGVNITLSSAESEDTSSTVQNKPGESYTVKIGDYQSYDYHPEVFDNQYKLNLNFEEPDYKFNEGKLIEEFKKHVDNTYKGHYAKEKFQATEFIIDGGHGTGFCIGNILKYAQRYGKKGDRNEQRRDLMKILHYALIQLDVHDNEYK